jgi:eukaryotic-like serine/threonine-protein kinase
MTPTAPGTRLGPYLLVDRLGEGGMGEVFRARDARLDRDVAIKVLSRRIAVSSDALARLEREAKAVASLSHPNILSIFDFGREGDVTYLVTELLEGRTLRQVLREEKLDEQTIVRWGTTIAEGVAAAHARGIVHRDLKPENIFVTSEGRIKILDFGLARTEVASLPSDGVTEVQLTQDGTMLGTVGYMAPEQARGEQAGPRSDVFSLGCVLYEMVKGTPPFHRETAIATLSAILSEQPPTVDSPLRPIIDRCLEKQPAKRFANAEEVAAAISGVRVANPRSRRMRAGLVAAAALIAVALGASYFIRGADEPAVQANPASLTSATAAADEAALIVMMPVETGSPEPPAHFVGAIQEEVERRLAQREGVRILPPGSTAALSGASDMEELLRVLGVDSILRMTVSGPASEISVALEVESPPGQFRSARVSAANLSAVSALAGAEVENLLGLAAAPGSSSPASTDPKAMDLYYQARHFWSKRGEEDVRRSIQLFQEAIDVDPKFALAFVGLADAYAVLHNASGLPTDATFPRARAAARRALEIDPDLPEAQVSLAYIDHYYELDWESAEARYRRAIELRPDHATAHQWYAELLTVTGRPEEARKMIEKAMALDPLSPIISGTAIWLDFMARQYDRAVQTGRGVMAANPNDPRAMAYTARALVEQGRFDEAEKLHRQAADLSGSAIMNLWLAECLARSGRPGEARHILASIESTGTYINPYYHALPHIALGNHPRALTLLEQAVETRVEQRAWLHLDPSLDPLRERNVIPSAARDHGGPGIQ